MVGETAKRNVGTSYRLRKGDVKKRSKASELLVFNQILEDPNRSDYHSAVKDDTND